MLGNRRRFTHIVPFPIAGNAVTQDVFVAMAPVKVIGFRWVHATAGGAAAALQLYKNTGTQAPAGGTALLAAAFDLTAAANTVQTKTPLSSLTAAQQQLNVGERLGAGFTGTVTGLVGGVLAILFQEL